MAVRTANRQGSGWSVDEASEVLEFREKEDGLREYRHHCTVVVSRNLDGMTSWKATGSISDNISSGNLAIRIASSDVPPASNIVSAAGTQMIYIGVDPAGGVESYSDLTKISDITSPEGPKGSEIMRQTQEWVSVSDWADYPYDEA
jgi:hypothetical protein